MSAPQAVKMQFDTLAQQRQANLVGIWILIATEVMFFGGLFLVYSVYRWLNPEAFAMASQELNLTAGTVNTAVLLTSSFTIALADRAIGCGRRKMAQVLMAITIGLGLAFLAIKGYEYHQEYQHGLIPFINEPFAWHKAQPDRAKIFFNLYFVMTGLHALHLFIGCCLLTTMLLISRRSHNLPRVQSQIMVNALYWHFVDVVWVFLFPLLYLAR